MGAQVDWDTIANDYTALLKGQLSEAELTADTDYLRGLVGESAYGAIGALGSALIWAKCECSVLGTGGQQFEGKCWGLSGIGGGPLWGDVYTDDIDRLYGDTAKFTLIAAIAYTTFLFKDGDGNHLGSFQAGSATTTAGGGSGDGSWSSDAVAGDAPPPQG